MTIKRPQLIFESYEDNSNYLFLTMIEYKRVKYLTIIENIICQEIQAYVLDNLQSENIDQDWFMSVAINWFYSASDRYPLSFEFAKLNKQDIVHRVLKTFNINSTSRLIGKIFVYQTKTKSHVKRRKVIGAPVNNEIKFREVSQLVRS